MLLARCSRSVAFVCVRAALAVVVSLSVVLVSGCGLGTLAAPSAASSALGAALTGAIHGGQQPVSGSHVYLFAAGVGGYGTSAVSVLTTHANTAQDATGVYVLSDADGNFNITGDYTCPHVTDQMYILAKGGSPSPGVTNSAIAMIAVLGTCSSLSASTTVVVNELTTVAAAYALSGFIVDGTHVASSGTTLAVANLAMAFATANNLVNSATGIASPATTNNAGVVPVAEINTIADIIAVCVNSSDLTSTCQSVESTVTPPSGVTIPSDTVGIAINFNKYPTLNVTNSFLFNPAIGPFQPTLSTPPNDWTIAVYYPLPATGVPGKLAVDADGSVWIPICQRNCTSSSLPGLVHHLTNLGVTLSGSGYTTGVNKAPYVATLDLSGRVWIGYTGGVSRLDSSGSVSTGFPVNNSSLLNIVDLAIDGSTNVWGTDAGSPNNDVVLFASNGLAAVSFSFTSQFYNPSSIAVDSSGVAWATGQCTAACTNGVSARLLRISAPNSNASYQYYDVGGGGINTSLVGIAITANKGTVAWGGTTQTGYLTTSTGTPGGAYTAQAGDNISYQTMDGQGGLFLASTLNNRITATANSRVTPGATGLVSPALTAPRSLAADGAGNLWTVGCYAAAASCPLGLANQNALFEFIGLASPTITPLVAATSANKQGSRP